jgi:hypothetical protein
MTSTLSNVRVSNAGDINNDGVDDCMIGVPLADVNSSSLYVGNAFVIFGRQKMSTNIHLASPSFSLSLTPNPPSEVATIQSKAFASAKDVCIHLYDLWGREVALEFARISEDAFRLNLKSLSSGSYILRIVADGEVGIGRLIRE